MESPAKQSAESSTTAPSKTPLTKNPPNPGGDYSSLLFIVILWGAVLYFFFMRPQKKKDAARKEMLNTLKKGDKVVTIGGIHGTVTLVKDDTVNLKVDDKAGTTMTFQRAAINDIPGKTAEDA